MGMYQDLLRIMDSPLPLGPGTNRCHPINNVRMFLNGLILTSLDFRPSVYAQRKGGMELLCKSITFSTCLGLLLLYSSGEFAILST